MASTCRATAAQATIRFLKNQNLERDGIEHQFFLGLLGIVGHGKQTSRIFVFLRLASRSPFKHQAVPEGGGAMFVCPARSLYPNLSQ
jgi:hypothetical protein